MPVSAPAYLSRLENGRLSPTVSTLTRVMQALGEPVSRVFGDDDLAGPVVRVQDRRVIRNRGVDDYLLSPTRSGRLEVIETIIQPGEGSGEPPYSHPGDEECIVVLEGTLRVWVDEDEYDLRPGDAITFPCRSPHRWENPGPRRDARPLGLDACRGLVELPVSPGSPGSSPRAARSRSTRRGARTRRAR